MCVELAIPDSRLMVITGRIPRYDPMARTRRLITRALALKQFMAFGFEFVTSTSEEEAATHYAIADLLLKRRQPDGQRVEQMEDQAVSSDPCRRSRGLYRQSFPIGTSSGGKGVRVPSVVPRLASRPTHQFRGALCAKKRDSDRMN